MFRSRTPHLTIFLCFLIATLTADATAQTITFSRLQRFLSVVGPSDLVAADFNKDGNLDLAISDAGLSQVVVILGNGNGTFGPQVGFDSKGDAQSLITGDFNNDGNPDLAMGVQFRNSVVVLFGTGNGNFSPALELPKGNISNSPLNLVAGDFDRDGTQDLVVIDFFSSVFFFLKSNGNGTFGPYTPAGNNRDEPLAIIQTDFNLDGNLDIATAHWHPFGINVALGTGAGTFLSPFEIATTSAGALALAAGDLNQDGFPDLAFLHRFPEVPALMSIVLGNGDGTFGPQTNVPTGIGPTEIVMDDFSLDGDLDLAVANFLSDSMSIFPGTDDIFQVGPEQHLGLFDRPIALASGDFNNDCRPDLAVITGLGVMQIFLNTTPKPPLEIVGVELSKSVLWPPNHKMVDVTIDYSVTNNCGPATCALTVVSNEPINGNGDGDSAPDWEVIDDHLVRLRAERAGKGSGRIYTITITCTDRTGNSSSKAVTVTVPKNQRK